MQRDCLTGCLINVTITTGRISMSRIVYPGMVSHVVHEISRDYQIIDLHFFMSEKTTTSEAVVDDANLDIRDPRVYEIGFLILPTVPEEKLEAEVDALRKIVTDNGGLPISEGRAELMDLAYSMDMTIKNERHTFAKAYFGWIKFDVTPEKVDVIHKALKGQDNLLRFLLVKTVRQDAVVTAPSQPRTESSSRKEEQPAEPLDEALLDKQIDDLVVEDEGDDARTETSEQSE